MAVKKNWLAPLVLGILAVFIWFFYWKFLVPSYLTFSDAAKFADIARNYVSGKGFGSSFSPWSLGAVETKGIFPVSWGSPLQPALLSIAFKVLGVKDWVVILTSGFFYLLGAMALYYLGKRIFSTLVGVLASLAFIFDPAMLNYATSGASESLFIFEIILAALLFYCAATSFAYLNSKVSQFLGSLVLLLMYFTRPSAIIYIAGFIFLFVLLHFKKKIQILRVSAVAVAVWLVIEIVLMKFSGKFFLYSPLARFISGTTSFSSSAASTVSLRGGGNALVIGLKPLLSKLFYNLYNFYKLLPQILSPYLAGFYFLSLFLWEKEREKRIFRLIVLFLVVATFFVSAAFLPIYRYLHPVIPFIYLLAVEMIVWTVNKVVSGYQFVVRKKSLTINHQSLVIIISFLLLFVFVVGQTTGKIFLDSRYLRAHTNPNKPPVYVKLAQILRENTDSSELIITNLDTWGSWYGERKTIWFPLEPSQLIPPEGKKLGIDAIYLTSYKMDDENYFMGKEWREIFYQPEKLEDLFFAKNFKFAERFEIKPEDTYEKEGASAVLLLKKE